MKPYRVFDFIVSCCVGMIALGGCNAVEQDDAAEEPISHSIVCSDSVQLDEEDDETSVFVPVGAEIKLVLMTNWSTGVCWRTADIDEIILVVTDFAYEPYPPCDEPDSEYTGCSGDEVRTYVAKQGGRCLLKLEHNGWGVPAGSEDELPLDTFEVSIIVIDECPSP